LSFSLSPFSLLLYIKEEEGGRVKEGLYRGEGKKKEKGGGKESEGGFI